MASSAPMMVAAVLPPISTTMLRVSMRQRGLSRATPTSNRHVLETFHNSVDQFIIFLTLEELFNAISNVSHFSTWRVAKEG